MLKDVPLIQGFKFWIFESLPIESEYPIEGYLSVRRHDGD
jgi:hypothetical protein